MICQNVSFAQFGKYIIFEMFPQVNKFQPLGPAFIHNVQGISLRYLKTILVICCVFKHNSFPNHQKF